MFYWNFIKYFRGVGGGTKNIVADMLKYYHKKLTLRINMSPTIQKKQFHKYIKQIKLTKGIF